MMQYNVRWNRSFNDIEILMGDFLWDHDKRLRKISALELHVHMVNLPLGHKGQVVVSRPNRPHGASSQATYA